MTSLINVTAKALTVACDAIGALDAVNKMCCARERFGNAEGYELLTRTASLAMSKNK